MEAVAIYLLEKGKPLWLTFAKADRVVNLLGANGIEGCRFELDNLALTVLVPKDLVAAVLELAL